MKSQSFVQTVCIAGIFEEDDQGEILVLRAPVQAVTTTNQITSGILKMVFKYLYCVLNPEILNVWLKYQQLLPGNLLCYKNIIQCF